MSSDRRERAARAEQMRHEREKADRRQRDLITVAIVAVVVLLIALGGFAIKGRGGDDTPVVAPAHLTDPPHFAFDYTAADAGGKDGAKTVKVVLYEDFQCPVCKAFEQANGAYLDQQVKAGAVTIQYRPHAFLDASSSTHYATRSMNAAMCVLDRGGVAAFKKMHDILYANQPEENTAGLPNSALVGFATQAGVPGLDSCINKEKFSPWVKKANSRGEDDGVHGTPTVVIDGKVVNGSGGADTVPQTADLQKAIAAAS